MSSRRLSDWLSGYLKYASNTEPPISYHTWIGLSMIAGVLQRRCYLRWGFETIYPNLYIVLVGPSGRCRKGTAISLGKDILTQIQSVSLTSESTTREALIKYMKEATKNFSDPDLGVIRFHCSLMCISEELSVFLGQNDIKFLADLTDWYDSRDKWTYRTKSSGTDEIEGVCFNLLGATAADWLQSILPQEAIGGGFTSRIIFIVEENKGKTVPVYNRSSDENDLRKYLIEDLERISTMAGEFTFSPDAQQQYVQWYQNTEAQGKKGKYAIDDPRFAGYCDRRATHIRKLCMIFSASRSNDQMIQTIDFDRALKTLNAAEVKMPRVFGGLGTAKYSQATEKILTYIANKKVVKRADLLLKFYRDVDGPTLEIIEDVLEKMKVITIARDPVKGEVIYTYKGE